MKPSNLTTPRTLSEGTFSVGYSSVRSHRKTAGVISWLGWIAFAILAVSLIGSR